MLRVGSLLGRRQSPLSNSGSVCDEEVLAIGTDRSPRRVAKRWVWVIGVLTLGIATISVGFAVNHSHDNLKRGQGSPEVNSLVDAAKPIELAVSPDFSVGTAQGKHNALYQFHVVNTEAYTVALNLASTRLPPGLTLLSKGLSANGLLNPHATGTLALAIHIDRCSRPVGHDPIVIPADKRGGASSWQSVRVTPPGAGPRGSWEVEVRRAACGN